MTTMPQHLPRRAASFRLATVLALLAGVLAMHAVTVGHDPGAGLSSGHVSAAAVGVNLGAAAAGPAAQEAHTARAEPAVSHAAPASETAVGHGGTGMGAMAEACLVVLAAAALGLWRVWLARSRRRRDRTPLLTRALGSVRRVDVARPAPSLSSLGVLRI